MAEYAKDVLVDTQWVEDHLDDDSIRIVEVDENPALYAESHIPGAIGFDWKTDLQDQVKRDFLGPEAFGELFGSRGISNDHTVVLYGDRNNWFAAYTYWYLKYYGHDNVKLVNGPREKWIAEGRADVHRRAELPGRDLHRPARRRRDPRQARRGPRRPRIRHQARRRPLAAGVLRRADRDAGLRAGGRPARRPHPRRRLRAVGPGRRRGRHVQVGRRARQALRRQGRHERQRRSSPTAASASAPRTPGSCSTSCSARSTSRTTTARGRSGATSSTCPSRRAERPARPSRPAGAHPVEQVADDPPRRAPDERPADLVGVRPERHALAHEPAEAVAGAHVAQPQLEHLGDLGGLRHPGEARLDDADEGVDRVVRDERRRRGQRAHQADALRRQPDLLLGLPQGGRAQVLVGVVLPAAGEGDLPGVGAQVVAPPGEDRAQGAALVAVERDEDRGVRAAVDVERRRRRGRHQERPEVAREPVRVAQASSTRSSKATSPSSVRCTGHFAAMTCRRSTCSALRWSGRRRTSLNFVGQPRSAGA